MSEASSSQQHPGAEAEAAAAAPQNAAHVDIPGVRFVPSDQELIRDYLLPRIHGQKPLTDIVREADVYAEHPKDLTKKLGKSVEGFWYVFSERNRKYPKGHRPSRSTRDKAGRWKAVGKNLSIVFGADKETIGHKCGLAYELFVRDDPASRPRTVKTEWKMCEFVAGDTDKPISPETAPGFMLLNDVVLCRITRKAAADQVAVLEDQGQAAVVEEPEEDEQQVPTALPPDPSQQARAQLMTMPYNLLPEGANGAEVGTERVDADLEQPGDGYGDGPVSDVHFVEWSYHPEQHWGDGYGGVAFDPDQWNQFGATTDPDPMASHYQVPADPIQLRSPSPSDPQSWDFASTLFADDSHEPVEDEIVLKANDDTGEDSTAANKNPAPANADSQALFCADDADESQRE